MILLQVPTFGDLKSPNSNIPTFPIMYPTLVPGLFPPQLDHEQMNRQRGLYAVPVLPFMQPVAGFPSNIPNTLIPFTYNVPTERSAPEIREAGGEQGQPGEQHQQAGPQRQVIVRRFQIAIQLDLLLILKLAAVIFLFNQDGSKQRLTLLVFFAILVYLYQTGALAPVIRWLSQGMRRAAAPPEPQRPAVRADNLPAAGGQGNENVGAEGPRVGENENQQVNEGNGAIENENAGQGGQGEAVNRWWVIVKEIQMIVFGFITSLLPGFHNNID
ncbi:hypothetical protein BUALT_Bualt11G0080700 [Buddleja alternifolia]|uniref:Transmembrane protein n=1 Tax=Buddleja alternifolia TaxID=168488 RepID=A0AAV6WUA9_9LAMI|nr:hypothetical protein BUALT_Bualt11G0080700 [Buddleja alternifolia]